MIVKSDFVKIQCSFRSWYVRQDTGGHDTQSSNGSQDQQSDLV